MKIRTVFAMRILYSHFYAIILITLCKIKISVTWCNKDVQIGKESVKKMW